MPSRAPPSESEATNHDDDRNHSNSNNNSNSNDNQTQSAARRGSGFTSEQEHSSAAQQHPLTPGYKYPQHGSAALGSDPTSPLTNSFGGSPQRQHSQEEGADPSQLHPHHPAYRQQQQQQHQQQAQRTHVYHPSQQYLHPHQAVAVSAQYSTMPMYNRGGAGATAAGHQYHHIHAVNTHPGGAPVYLSMPPNVSVPGYPQHLGDSEDASGEGGHPRASPHHHYQPHYRAAGADGYPEHMFPPSGSPNGMIRLEHSSPHPLEAPPGYHPHHPPGHPMMRTHHHQLAPHGRGKAPVTKKNGGPTPPSVAAAALLDERTPEEMQLERERRAAEYEQSLASVKPIATDFHWFTRGEDGQRESVPPEIENDLYLRNSYLNASHKHQWETVSTEQRMEHLKQEEADRRRFTEEEEVASRHCATLTARAPSATTATTSTRMTTSETDTKSSASKANKREKVVKEEEDDSPTKKTKVEAATTGSTVAETSASHDDLEQTTTATPV